MSSGQQEPVNGHAGKPIRVGSRKSLLAQFQTKYVISRLQKLYPDRQFEIHIMSTMGDRVLNVSLPKIGEKSLFTKDLEDALRNGGVDFVVHSLKDLPTSLPAGMAIGAILERGDPRDALILNEKHRGATLSTLPAGSIIGTSSLRRTAQIMRKYPHLVVNDVRGNLNTRLAKLDAPSSKFSGLILAQVGVERMGWRDRIDQVLEPEDIMYAVGQGALAVECRANDEYILEMLERITSYESECEILAERSFLKTLGGGCSAPVAVHTILKQTAEAEIDVEIRGGVWSLDGKEEILASVSQSLGVVRKRRSDKGAANGSDSEGDVVPAKQAKLDGQAGSASDNSSDGDQEKRKSPLIIDETKLEFVESDQEAKPLDIQALINIHGDLFKNCPFSSQLKSMAAGGLEKTAGDVLLLGGGPSSGIGQEVMGECPVLNMKEKVELLNAESSNVGGGDAIGKCPVTHRQGGENNSGGGGEAKAQCPFTKRRSSASTAIFPTMLEVNGVDSCPYMNSIKMIDCDENRNFIDTLPTKAHAEGSLQNSNGGTEGHEVVDANAQQLYCGLICHKTIDAKVLETCEALGRRLAEKIIGQGGLEIMKVAQSTIHSKIGTTN